jgi:PleD family two-component response regulator
VAENLDSLDDGPSLARRIEEAMSQPFSLPAGAASIGASVGIRALRPGDTPVSLLADADQVMYRRKSIRRVGAS